jgi:hypothetical protein
MFGHTRQPKAKRRSGVDLIMIEQEMRLILRWLIA